MNNPYPYSFRICENCNCIESTGCVLRWYWDDKTMLHLLCEQCAEKLKLQNNNKEGK